VLVAWHSGRTSVSDWRTFPVLRSTCSWWVTTDVGKQVSHLGQLRLSSFWVDKWVVSWNQMCAAVYRQRHLVKAMEVTAGLAESNGSLLPCLWCDSLHVTCGLTACTPGSGQGPTLGNEYGKTLPLPFVYRYWWKNMLYKQLGNMPTDVPLKLRKNTEASKQLKKLHDKLTI